MPIWDFECCRCHRHFGEAFPPQAGSRYYCLLCQEEVKAIKEHNLKMVRVNREFHDSLSPEARRSLRYITLCKYS